MSAEYQPNLSFVSQIPAEFLKLREYSANPDISWIILSASRNLKKNSSEGSVWYDMMTEKTIASKPTVSDDGRMYI